jgi:hypothetical protein
MPVVRGTVKRLVLNEEVLRNCYGFLQATEPFCHWGLPDKHDVVFGVTRARNTCGDYTYRKLERQQHLVRISSRCVGTCFRLCMIMGHEMIHVAESKPILNTVTRGAQHNRAFLKMADEVCTVHGFDRLDFAEIE